MSKLPTAVAAGSTRTASPSNQHRYVGNIDVCNETEIQGWCFRIDRRNAKQPVNLLVRYSRKDFIVPATDYRPDVASVHGVPFGAFRFEIPRWCREEDPEIFFETTSVKLDYRSQRKKACHKITEAYGAAFHGWAYKSGKLFSTVELALDGQVVSRTTASLGSPHLQAKAIKNGVGGFSITIPPAARRPGTAKLTLTVDGEIALTDERAVPPIRALIVSETDNLTDASRKYRCDHLCHLLRRGNIDAHLIGPTEFITKEWPEIDILIIARLGADQQLLQKLSAYKAQYNTRIIFEVDDLIFFPWHTHDLGSVRSGVDDPNSPDLIRMFLRRLNLVTLADAAITSTPLLAEHLQNCGLQTLVLPNMVHAHEFKRRTRTDGLRLLCMAGSPTHYKDWSLIEAILQKFLQTNPTVTMKLLGRFRAGTEILTLENVTHVDRLPYSKMLQAIDESDVCLVPLENTEFNNAKSCLKYIECGARGVPVIASPTADYARAIRHGENGLLANSAFEWHDLLERCLLDAEMVENIGLRAQQDVSENYCLENTKIDVCRWIKKEH